MRGSKGTLGTPCCARPHHVGWMVKSCRKSCPAPYQNQLFHISGPGVRGDGGLTGFSTPESSGNCYWLVLVLRFIHKNPSRDPNYPPRGAERPSILHHTEGKLGFASTSASASSSSSTRSLPIPVTLGVWLAGNFLGSKDFVPPPGFWSIQEEDDSSSPIHSESVTLP